MIHTYVTSFNLENPLLCLPYLRHARLFKTPTAQSQSRASSRHQFSRILPSAFFPLSRGGCMQLSTGKRGVKPIQPPWGIHDT